jgi:ribosomal protein S18 acetylase RimI-like enzyme
MIDAPPTWREERDDDLFFLRKLYASTRAEELAPLNWTDDQLDAFLTMQFDAQRAHYRANYPDADFLVLLLGSERVGRLYVDRGEHETLLIDIALLPRHRGAGIGTDILRQLTGDAADADRPLRLSVDKTSAALRLYRRLGFAVISDNGLSWRMEWRPPAPGQAR